MTQIAVVILNYNGREFLKKFLPPVIEYSPGAQIIVADNHSTDDSLALLQDSFPSVERIMVPENRGFAGGYNFALEQVKAKYFVLLNSDVEVTPDWLTPMFSKMESDPTLGAIQPKILSHSNRQKFDYAGAGGGFIDALGYPFCRGRIFNEVEEDTGQFDDDIPIFWSSGACMMIRSELFVSLHGLDEDFFAHMEEIDLCWRIHRSGYKINYTGASRVYHVGGGTLATVNPRKTYFNFRNGLSMLIKHLPTSHLWWKLPIRIMLDWIAATKFLFEGSPSHSLAVANAHLHWILSIPNQLKKRYSSRLAMIYPAGPVYSGSLVLDFFIKGKKKFKDLSFQ